MENQVLMGTGNALRTKNQAFLMLLAAQAGLLNADIAKMLTAPNAARYYRKDYYLTNEVTGGNGSSNDLVSTLPITERVGVTNINGKKIEDNTAFVVDRLELVYASSTATGAAADIVPTLQFTGVNGDVYGNHPAAPAAITNGEIEFLVKDRQICKIPVAAFNEPDEGTHLANAFGYALRALQLVQANETIGVRLYTAGALDNSNGLRHFVKFFFCGEGVRPKA